jgi:predicted transcriptional regulator
MAKRTRDRLAGREREIVNAVFALGNRASAEDVRGRLVDAPSSSTVRVMLTRLEKKGYLRHTTDGPRFVYSATVAPTTAKKNALRQFAHTFFGGSLGHMMQALIRDERWSELELDALREEIERARRRKREP